MPPATATTATTRPAVGPRYKWIALSNTTLGMLMATVNSSIVLIALPNIFRGIGVNPLQPGNTTILLWMLMGFLVVTAVLVVSFGRLGDMFGRVRMYNMGFAVFAAVLDPAVRDLAARRGRRLVPDRDADLPGRRRRHADGQLRRHPHRRLPGQPARARARPQPGRRHRRLVHRPGPRRRARPDQLALRLPRLRPVRRPRHRLVLPQAEGTRRPQARQARLVGQRDLRRRPDRRPRRHHLRHPALRRPHDGLDEPAGARRSSAAAWPSSPRSASSRPGSTTRCSACRCSGSARSRPATWRACCPASAAAA